MYLPFHLFSLIAIVLGFGISSIIYLEGRLLRKMGFALSILTLCLTVPFVYGYSFIGYVADYLTFYTLIMLWSVLNFSMLKSKKLTSLGVIFMFLGVVLLLSGSFPFGKEIINTEILQTYPKAQDNNNTTLYFKNAYPNHAVSRELSYNDFWKLVEKRLIFEKEVAFCVHETNSDSFLFKTMKADPIEYYKYLTKHEPSALVGFSLDSTHDKENIEERLGMSNFYKFQNQFYFIEDFSGKRTFFMAIPY